MDNTFIVSSKRKLVGGTDGKPLDGVYVCSNCDNIEAEEREVNCWYCEIGEMLWYSRERLCNLVQAEHKSQG